MSLHDRIMAMSAPDNVVSHPLCMGGYSVAQQRAAEMAKEADDLMAEMADALDCYIDEPYISGPAKAAIHKYNAWKERTQ